MRTLAFLIMTAICFEINAQQTTQEINLHTLTPDKEITDVYAKKLYSDSLASTFVIWIKTAVPLHKHEWHTEQIMVIEGTAEMVLGDTILLIKASDLVIIPKGTPHAVKVTSAIPLKVLSIQAPEYNGNDRIKLE